MAKQRPNSKSKSPASSHGARGRSGRPKSASGARKSAARAKASPASPPLRRTYVEAVALYERGLEALQRHDYGVAQRLFGSVLEGFPEERELQERVRLYLSICNRHAAPGDAAPQTIEERLYASTLALNRGRYDQAISHLRLVRDEDPDNDHALYMLAVAHAQRGEHLEAMAHLVRAIALNPENRAQARHDPDLEPLRGDEAFQAATERPAPAPRADRRRPPRPSQTAR